MFAFFDKSQKLVAIKRKKDAPKNVAFCRAYVGEWRFLGKIEQNTSRNVVLADKLHTFGDIFLISLYMCIGVCIKKRYRNKC